MIKIAVDIDLSIDDIDTSLVVEGLRRLLIGLAREEEKDKISVYLIK